MKPALPYTVDVIYSEAILKVIFTRQAVSTISYPGIVAPRRILPHPRNLLRSKGARERI